METSVNTMAQFAPTRKGTKSGPLYARHRAHELRSVPCVVCPRYFPDGQDLKEILPVFNVHEEVPFWRNGHAPGERAPQKGVHIDEPGLNNE